MTEVEEPTGEGVVVDVHAAGWRFPTPCDPRPLPVPAGPAVHPRSRDRRGGAIRAGGRRCASRRQSRGPDDAVRRHGRGRGVVPDRAFKLPDNASFEAGAGLLFNDLTMYFALTVRGQRRQGETVLVHGAAGGIGTSTLRLAPVLGPRAPSRWSAPRRKARSPRRPARPMWCWPRGSRMPSRSSPTAAASTWWSTRSAGIGSPHHRVLPRRADAYWSSASPAVTFPPSGKSLAAQQR